MKNSALITVLATAAVATAQVTVDNGTYICAKPNVAYCAGDSMKTDIIIRCNSEMRGQPGRCSDNLAGEPPVGVRPALCYQTDNVKGDAACEKNCIVYGGSGNGAGIFTLPASICTPEFSATGTSSGGIATTTTTSTSPPPPPATSTTEETTTPPAVVVPTTTAPPAPVYPTGNNGTVITSVPSPVQPSTGPPVVPTTTGPAPISTAGAAVNVAGGLLAGLGMAVAYVL
ncbi:hypothetical protein GE09DRAFT_1217184 [Coniochaeta sp. 2T2.1]|nr:hypothetical protein GE09DRAFT_1217184 [Coniochaeta sp. 2T2.1]